MKQSFTFERLALLAAGIFTVLAILNANGNPPPPCNAVGGWSCSQHLTLNSGGTLDKNVITVCVGETIVKPTLATRPTFNNGSKSRNVTINCPGQGSSFTETVPVRHVSQLTFNPAIPTLINTPMTFTTTAKVTARPISLLQWWKGESTAEEFGVNHATAVGGVSYGPGRVGNGFVLDGQGGRLQLANSAELRLQNFSIEMWVKRGSATKVTKNAGEGDARLFTYGFADGYSFGVSDSGHLYFTQNNTFTMVTPVPVLTGTGFHHVVVTKSGTLISLYVNGLLRHTATCDQRITFNSAPAIGGLPVGGKNFWGTIDEVSFYSCPLTLQQILNIYGSGLSGAGKCLTSLASGDGCNLIPADCACANNAEVSLGTVTINVGIDSDNDQLLDCWEVSYFGDLTQNPTGDYDNDTLTNLEEQEVKSHPKVTELKVIAHKTTCGATTYVYFDVANLSGKTISGGAFKLYTWPTGQTRNLYSTLQPWSAADVLPSGSTRRFSFTTTDTAITSQTFVVLHEGATQNEASPRFQVVVRDETALLLNNTTFITAPCLECLNCVVNNPPPIPVQARPYSTTGTCGTWPNPLPALADPARGGSPQRDNFYAASSPAQQVPLTGPTSGFKNVYATKQWQGSSPWTADQALYTTMGDDCACLTRGGVPASPFDRKYLRMDINVKYDSKTFLDGELWFETHDYLNSASSVNRLTGKLTGTRNHSGSVETLEILLNDHWLSADSIAYAYCQEFSKYKDSATYEAPGVEIDFTYTTGSNPTFNYVASSNGIVGVTANGSLSLGSGGASYTVTTWNSHSTGTTTASVNATTVTYKKTWNGTLDERSVGGGLEYNEGEESVTITLSNPYTNQQLNQDTDDLLATWNLQDDVEYPWRGDGGLNRGPLVTRNEKGGVPGLWPGPVTFNEVELPWIDEGYDANGNPNPPSTGLPQPSQPPGAVIGAPLPVHGPNGARYAYEPYFNFYHTNYRFEWANVGLQAIPDSHGAFSPFPNATQWIDDNAARIMPSGPFWAYGSTEGRDHFRFWLKHDIMDTDGNWFQNTGMGGSLVKCKWAETIVDPQPTGKDFVFKDWKFNFRDFEESYRTLIARYARIVDNQSRVIENERRAQLVPPEPPLPLCPGISAAAPVRFTELTDNYPNGNIIGPGSWWISQMDNTPLHYNYVSDCRRPAVFVQPHSPGSHNGVFVQMPPAICDEGYGSLWMGRVDQSTANINTCANYVANRNADIANPATCDPQIELDLQWHQRYDDRGNPRGDSGYELVVHPLGFPYGGSPKIVDLDIDSDNNNGLEQSLAEENIEDDPALPGKLVLVNDGDANDNGVPGYADWDETSATTPNRFTLMWLKIPNDVDIAKCRIKFEYNASPPSGVISTGTPAIWRPAPGVMRLWKKDADQSRNPATARNSPSADYVEPGMYNDITTLGFSESLRIVPLYVEGIYPSANPNDGRIVVTLYEGTPPSVLSIDAVRVTVLVPGLLVDQNHDGKIDGEDRWHIASTGPFRFWINDDIDSGDDGGNDVPGQPDSGIWADYHTDASTGLGNIDGTRDLIDFFPVALEINKLLSIFPPSTTVKYKLKQEHQAVNVVFTSLSPAYASVYQTSRQLADYLLTRNTCKVTSAGLVMPSDFLAGLANGQGGLILVEGRAVTTRPLKLIVENQGATVVEIELPLRIGEVESMFRHKNLNNIASGGSNQVADRPDAPNSPDNLTNGKNFVFLHGYNVNQQQARGWSAELFKRMYWAGSKAKFYAVSWYAYETQVFETLSYNLQTNTIHAFETAPALAGFLNSLNGETVVAGHSLGNMILSAAITLNDGNVSKYFMIDGAVAMEAFDTGSHMDAGMINLNWSDYVAIAPGDVGRLFASEWYEKFQDATDARSKLTWRGLFTNWRNTVVFNYYSSGEEVMANIPGDKGNNFSDLADAAKFSWGCQEKLKGRIPTHILGNQIPEFLGSQIAGWGFNDVDYGTWIGSDWTPEPYSSAAAIPPAQLVTKPFFKNSPATLYSDNDITARNYAQAHYYELLARAIPATTFGIGANPTGQFEESIDMQTLQLNLWPASRGLDVRWKHSDCRNVAYIFTFKLFKDMVTKGELK